MPADDLHDHLVTFGRSVRRLRRELDLSQDAVERRGGMVRSHVGMIERAERDVQFTSLVRLARGLGVPLSEIVRRYEDT